jgi:hypothetical protein
LCNGEPCPPLASCQRKQVAVSCAPLPVASPELAGRWRCTAEGQSSVLLAASSGDGKLLVRSLSPSSPSLTLLKVLTPEWWLLQTETAAPVNGAKRWVSLWRATDETLTETLSFPADGAPPEVLDLDGDGLDEVLALSDNELRVGVIDPVNGGLGALRFDAGCALVLATRARCETWRAAQTERLSAALTRANAIARAPPPEQTVRALRDALVDCKLSAAQDQVTPRLGAQLEQYASAQGHSFKNQFNLWCDALDPREDELRAATVSACELREGKAVCAVSSGGEVTLTFENGRWLIDQTPY